LNEEFRFDSSACFIVIRLALGKQGINFINEDNSRLEERCNPEKRTNKLLPFSNPFAGKRRRADREKSRATFVGNRLANECFPLHDEGNE
jgi:hypothetical protein